jgi:hypothetical protein
MNPLVIYPDEHLTPVLSLVVAYGLGLAVPLTLALVVLGRWAGERVAAARARASEHSDVPLRDGRSVIRGKVEFARGAPYAVGWRWTSTAVR